MINQHDPGVINHPGYYPLGLYIPFCRNQCCGTPIPQQNPCLYWGNLGQVMGTATAVAKALIDHVDGLFMCPGCMRGQSHWMAVMHYDALFGKSAPADLHKSQNVPFSWIQLHRGRESFEQGARSTDFGLSVNAGSQEDAVSWEGGHFLLEDASMHLKKRLVIWHCMCIDLSICLNRSTHLHAASRQDPHPIPRFRPLRSATVSCTFPRSTSLWQWRLKVPRPRS